MVVGPSPSTPHTGQFHLRVFFQDFVQLPVHWHCSEVPEGFPAVVGTKNIAYVTGLLLLSTQVRYRRSGALQLQRLVFPAGTQNTTLSQVFELCYSEGRLLQRGMSVVLWPLFALLRLMQVIHDLSVICQTGSLKMVSSLRQNRAAATSKLQLKTVVIPVCY